MKKIGLIGAGQMGKILSLMMDFVCEKINQGEKNDGL